MAKNSDSTIVVTSDLMAVFIAILRAEVIALGGSDADLFALNKGDGRATIRKMAELAVRTGKPAIRTLAELIAACRFGYVNSDITEERFPLTGEAADVSDMLTVTQKDLGGSDMTTAGVEAAIDRQGYRRATIAEQLAYAMAKWNGKDTVAALGSSWVYPAGFRLVPDLYGDDGQRRLNLYWVNPEDRWDGHVRFLVVRK